MLCPRLARHFDRPLPESSARICRQTAKHGSNRRVSVVNLNESQHVWIPGQQLFGEMIPRPEQEARLHEIELLRQTEKLERFRSLVKKSMDSQVVEATTKTMDLSAQGSNSLQPLALGYEVVQDFDSASGDEQTMTEMVDRKRLTVVLTTSEEQATNCTGKVDLLDESTGRSVFEQNDPYGEDAGAELESLGSYITLSFDHMDGTEVAILERRIMGAQDTQGAEVLPTKCDGLLAMVANQSSNSMESECDTPANILVQSQTI